MEALLSLEKNKSLTNTSYSNESKIKFLQILQGTTRRTCCQKYEKRDIVSAYAHIKCDTLLPLYAADPNGYFSISDV